MTDLLVLFDIPQSDNVHALLLARPMRKDNDGIRRARVIGQGYNWTDRDADVGKVGHGQREGVGGELYGDQGQGE
jgi:hypothetical protein